MKEKTLITRKYWSAPVIILSAVLALAAVLTPSTAFAANVPFSTGTITSTFDGARSVYAAYIDGEYFIFEMCPLVCT